MGKDELATGIGLIEFSTAFVMGMSRRKENCGNNGQGLGKEPNERIATYGLRSYPNKHEISTFHIHVTFRAFGKYRYGRLDGKIEQNGVLPVFWLK